MKAAWMAFLSASDWIESAPMPWGISVKSSDMLLDGCPP